jgi:hypothetical protein
LRFPTVKPRVSADPSRHCIVWLLSKHDPESETFSVQGLLWEPSARNIWRTRKPFAPLWSMTNKDAGEMPALYESDRCRCNTRIE